MRETSLLLAGGMKKEKAQKAAELLKEGLKEKNIMAEVTFVNTYEVTDLKSLEEGHDMVISTATGSLNTSLPVLQGLCLLYPWMGTGKLYEEVEKNLDGR